MWKGLGNIKSNLGDLTSKTLSQVAKAGNRAKEIINQVDNDDFFEREFGNAPAANPLDNPVAKNELKIKKKEEREPIKTGKNDSLNKIFEETLDISPIKTDNSLPKVFSMKKQKGHESSPEQVEEGKAKSNSGSSNNIKVNNPLKPALSETAETSISNPEDVLKGEIDDGWGVNDNIILNPTETKTSSESTKESKNKKTEEEKSKKGEEKGDNKQSNAADQLLQEKDEIIERFAEDNDKLIKERNELRTMSETFQHKVTTLDKNLTEVLAKNTRLEEEVKKLNNSLVEARKRTSVADIHTEVPEDRKEAMNRYIRDCMQQYENEISSKLLLDLNQEILQQITIDEEGVSDETKDLLQTWIVKPEMVQQITRDIVPEEKIFKPFYDEAMLREEIAYEKEENRRLRTQGEEYEERIRQLESLLEEEKNSRADYQKETEQTLKRYTEDFVKFEQNIENMEEELKEYKGILKARNDDIRRLEKESEEKNDQISSLEEKLKAEIAAKEDLSQQYDGIVAGMKEFETTMSDLNTDNERLRDQYEKMKAQLNEEKKRAKDAEHTLSIETKNNLLEKLRKLNALNSDLDIEKTIDSKLIYKEGRVSGNGLVASVETAIALTVEMANKKFQSQLQDERDRERDRYNTLSKNFDKMQDELKEATKREKDIQASKEEMKRKNDELTEMVESMNASAGQFVNKISSLQKTINELQDSKRKYLEEVGAKNEEIEQLKIKINSIQDESSDLNSYVAKLESEATAIPELSSKLEKQTMEINLLNEEIQAKEQENENLNTTINNLQSVIDENQQIQENLSNQYNNEIKKLRNDLEQSTRKSQILQEYKEKFEAIEKDFSEREAKIKELSVKLKESEQERNAVKAEASALVKKVKNEAMYKENLVDKRVLTNFLIKYFDPNATFGVKLGIMETMASILGFSDDERGKVGLPKQIQEAKVEKKPEEAKTEENKGTEQTPTNTEKTENQEKKEEEAIPKPTKSLKQMFMSFLQEADDK